MPTTDRTLFDRTIRQSLAVNEPPPSQLYKNRATTFDALIPLLGSRFYTEGVQRRLLIVYTDGESAKISTLFTLSLKRRVTPIFIHVWQPRERIYNNGRADAHYVADPSSAAALAAVARITDARVFSEVDAAGVVRAARAAVGRASTRTRINAYARVALAPWFVLAGIVPLGFLLWRRNV
jgi:hypothetical protein